MRYLLNFCFASTICLFTTYSHANTEFLPADQAFQFHAESLSKTKAQLKWQIAPHYYLYHDQFKVTADQTPLKLDLPKGLHKDDPTFGVTEVHYDQVMTEITVQPNTHYKIIWQGCSQDGLCYPLQSQTLETDEDGLFPQQNTSQNNHLSNSSQPSLLNQSKQTAIQQDSGVDVKKENSVLSSEIVSNQNNGSSLSLQWNDDKQFLNLFSADSLLFNLLIFFALGILLAFLPCSLPLIPIISTLIIQRKTGYKAAMIALSFIMSMALVYGVMGVFVAEIGYSFQRWFQSPFVISAFAILFVIFALNLFGLFQLSLPQTWLNKLNQFQDKQKAGTLLGSISMGALSALIVGPCMSAPLAGALLFVSQSHNAFLGGLYLFILGLGIGLPLFIASVFGTKLLPKPGIWMNHLKVCFGFLMLMMAVYFIRPMLDHAVYSFVFGVICLVLAIYLLKILKDSAKTIHRLLIILATLLSLFFFGWNIQQGIQSRQIEHVQNNLLVWNKVTTQAQLSTAMKEAQQQNKLVIVDVYADWCVACQPLEREVFPQADVQTALENMYLIKLDLSHYDESQDLILKQHEILGPPTLLFFDRKGQEIREIRLTGTFKANDLLKRLQHLQE